MLIVLGLEKAMAPHSSTLAWKIPWAQEPGRLQSMGSLRVGHDWATSLSLSCIGEGNGHPLHCSCLENPRDGVAWWAAVYGVAQSRTRLKRLSSSSRLPTPCRSCHLQIAWASFSAVIIVGSALSSPRPFLRPRPGGSVQSLSCVRRRRGGSNAYYK